MANQAEKQDAQPRRRAYVATFLAWLVPGAGHLYLGRRALGAAFLVLVAICLLLGCFLHGQLYHTFSGAPLTVLASLGCLGMGGPYLALLWGGYAGNLEAAGFEYGGAFLLTAGLMNLLLVLDAWDIAWGKK